MATSPNATPTPITPPRVPLIDERTGLIDRAWYLFFLSLFQNAQTFTDTLGGPSTESLLASYDAALMALAQETQTQPPPSDCCTEIDSVRQEVQSVPPAGVAELAQEVSNLRQEVQTVPPAGVAELAQEVSDIRQQLQTLPRTELGTFAALQQANLPWTTFDTTAESVPTDIGTVAWDGGTTLGVQMTPNVLQRVGETEFVYVKASAAITKGQLCYHTGSVGSSGVITAAPTPIGLTDPNQIVGVAAESIALNAFGLIQISGDLRGFDTTGSSVGETWADGDPLYYNPAYVGSMTKVKPLAPNQKSYIGEVINAGSGGSGSMHIRIVQGSVLGGTDSNVQFGTLANNDLIQYNTTLGYWTNVTSSSVSVGTATNLAGGVAGSLPYQTGAGATTFLSIGAANRVLTSSGTAPQWSTSLTGLTGVSSTTLNASSTIGLGVTPTAWDRPAYESTQNLALLGLANTSNLAQNAYFNAGWRYMTTAAASTMQVAQGSFNWFTAPSGSAGTAITFTQRLLLNVSGNLGLGTSSFGTNAERVLALGNATEPSSGPADTVQFYSVDRSAGNTIPAFYCEGSGVTNAGITSTAVTHKIAMKVNGTIYYLLATTNAT